MRKNPTTSRVAGPLPGGIELARPIGVDMEAVKASEVMPEVNMTPNNGTQRDVAQPPFANAPDPRYLPKTGGADPAPSIPGAK